MENAEDKPTRFEAVKEILAQHDFPGEPSSYDVTEQSASPQETSELVYTMTYPAKPTCSFVPTGPGEVP